MSSILADLIGLKHKATIAGKECEIQGLTFEEIGKLVARFESLRVQLISAVKEGKVSAVALISKAGAEAMAAVIAAGLGKIDDKDTEADAAKLTAGIALDFIDKIVEVSSPSGDGPLARSLTEAAKRLADTARALLPGGPLPILPETTPDKNPEPQT